MVINKENTNSAAELRTDAETKVAAQAVTNETLSSQDVKRLYHELQIHQVELEMQNKALHLTQLDLETTRDSYFDLYELAPVGYLTLNKNGLIQRVNLTAVTMLGLEKDALINKPIQKFIFRDDIDSFYLLSRSAIETSEDFKLELRFERSDGSSFWVNLQASLQNDDELWIAFSDIGDRKQLEQLLRQANDTLEEQVVTRTKELATLQREVAERKLAEEELRGSEQQFRVLIQNLKSAVALINEKGEFTIVNQVFLRLFELNDDSSIMNVNEHDWSQWKVFDENGSLLDVDDHPVRIAALTGSSVRDKLVAVKAPESPELKWLLVSAEPTLDAKGQIHRLICTYHDITARKLAEDALRESEERLVLASRAGKLGLFEWNTGATEAFWNAKHYELLGLEPGSPATFEAWQARVHPDDRDRVMRSAANLIADAQSGKRIESHHDEYRALWPDGTVIWLESVVSVEFDGNIIMRGAVRDITERKRAEEAVLRNQKMFSELIERSPFGTYIVDSQFRIAIMNTASQTGAPVRSAMFSH
jgi:PAS domain S-box-containing protein